ncbi:MAG: addiction module protein [Deltaproteobacteria bacterium]|nr:addiction module protein [Deltaproteobacteria bacterium]
MLSKIKEIEEEALQLNSRERALLIEHLINSLDDEEDPEAERLWIEEADRRYQEYRMGKTKGKSAELVFKEAHSKIR